MGDIAADRDGEPLDPSFVAADRERIEQRLGGVLMRAVAGVDDAAIDLAREQGDGAGGVMAHHENVGPHRVEGDRGVDQRLPFAHRGGADRHVHDVRAEPLAGELEGGLRAGRDLEEQVDLGAAAQRGALLLDLAIDLDEFFGEIEETDDLLARKPVDPQQVPLVEDERGFGRDIH